MQSTGHTSSHAVSLVPTQGSQMIYAIGLMILVSHWTCEPALAQLFVPSRVEVGRYEVCTTGDPIAAVVTEETAGGLHRGPVEPLGTLDAFGAAGPYNRAALARLFGGTSVKVARGWADRGDRFESVTL